MKKLLEHKRKPKHHHSDRDDFNTPADIAKRLISKIPCSDNDTWCDCCYGDGAFFDNFPTENKEFYEIKMGSDFLISNKKYDWIVSNIPFSKPKEFINKMSDNCIKGFGILCLANSMTATRLKMLESKGLFLQSITILYIKDWGFGYRTDFYVFSKSEPNGFEIIIKEK